MAVQHRSDCFLGLVVAIIFSGCDPSADSGRRPSMDQLAKAASAQRAAEEQKQQEAETTRKAQEEEQAAAQQVQPQIETVTSRSPKRGQSLQGGGYLSVVAGTRFWAEHEIIFNNIKHATRLYEAEHGRYPRTQEEFMREIIEPNLPTTALPELPDGWEYYYDPETPLELKMINKGGEPSAVQ